MICIHFYEQNKWVRYPILNNLLGYLCSQSDLLLKLLVCLRTMWLSVVCADVFLIFWVILLCYNHSVLLDLKASCLGNSF